MTNDTIEEIANDAHNLARHSEGVPTPMLKLGIEGLVSRLEKLVANQSFGRTGAPRAQEDDHAAAYARLFECPELNFKLTQFQTQQATRLIGKFEPVPKHGCEDAIPQNAKHIYEIRIDRTVKPYEAVAYCDGNFLFALKAYRYQTAKIGAVSVLFARMRSTCRKTRRNIAVLAATKGGAE